MASALAKKVRMQPGQRVLVMHAPPDYFEALGELPDGVRISREPDGEYDFVHLFVSSRAELDARAPAALRAVKYDGILWISYPKQSAKLKTDINRDAGWDIVFQAGLRPVTQVAINHIWSALRFRPLEKVLSRER
jgi:hypothetical protein